MIHKNVIFCTQKSLYYYYCYYHHHEYHRRAVRICFLLLLIKLITFPSPLNWEWIFFSPSGIEWAKRKERKNANLIFIVISFFFCAMCHVVVFFLLLLIYCTKMYISTPMMMMMMKADGSLMEKVFIHFSNVFLQYLLFFFFLYSTLFLVCLFAAFHVSSQNKIK